jgi:hypothetical protein
MFIFWTATAHENEDPGLQAAKSSMYFLTTASGRGFTYTLIEHKEWLAEAGLMIRNTYHFDNVEYTAVVAIKP